MTGGDREEVRRRLVHARMLGERFLEGFEKWLGEVQPHHEVHGSTATGRITADNPRTGFVGDPDAGVFAHPAVVTGVRPDDALYRNETFGPLVSVMRFSTFDEAVELANGHGYGSLGVVLSDDIAVQFLNDFPGRQVANRQRRFGFRFLDHRAFSFQLQLRSGASFWARAGPSEA